MKSLKNKILKAQIAKHDEMFQEYNMNAVVDFMKKLFVDLGEWYRKSDLSQKRVFLGSIFLSGIAWYYPGNSNLEIRPVYQAILDPINGSSRWGDRSEMGAFFSQ